MIFSKNDEESTISTKYREKSTFLNEQHQTMFDAAVREKLLRYCASARGARGCSVWGAR